MASAAGCQLPAGSARLAGHFHTNKSLLERGREKGRTVGLSSPKKLSLGTSNIKKKKKGREKESGLVAKLPTRLAPDFLTICLLLLHMFGRGKNAKISFSEERHLLA